MHLTTLSPPAFIGDAALVFLLWNGTTDWPADKASFAMQLLLAWMTFSKFIKLITHFARYPVDILLWPVSILFGWFHGLIKCYALATLSEVSHHLDAASGNAPSADQPRSQTTWGSRAGADASDSERMKPRREGRVLKHQGDAPNEKHDERYHEKYPLYDDMKSFLTYELKRPLLGTA